MPVFKIVDEGGSFFTVKNLPIFQMHTDRGFACDAGWMAEAIKNHVNYRVKGFRPTVIIGHNVRGGQEKEAVGFLDNLVLKGKRLYADIVRVPRTIKDKLVRNAFPNRSVEVLPKGKRILALALLGGTTPHFPLPQMTYEESREKSEWYRSPEMGNFTEDQEKELYELIGKAIGESVPDAIAKMFGGDEPEAGEGAEDIVTFTDESGEEYAIPVAILKLLGKLGKGAGKTALAAGGKLAPGGVARRGLAKAGKAAMAHPVAAGAGLAGAGVGAAALAARKRKGYAIDEEDGMVFLDEQPLGMVITFDEMQELGLEVPQAIKKPHKLPAADEEDPNLKIDTAAVGAGSGGTPGLTTPVGSPATSLIEPLAREESEQVAELETLAQQNYDLHHRVDTLETANALLSEGRRAEAYKQYLEGKRAAGSPVGNIEKTIEFLMTQSPEQVEEFKNLLEAQPKVAFERTEQPRTFDSQTAESIRQDYAQNKETFNAMGITEKDLKWAPFVRANRFSAETETKKQS